MDGLEIQVHGNAQDQLGQILKSGKMVVHGDVGQTFLYGAKGGHVYVMGNAAGRPLINAVGKPRVVINGTCLDFLAESFMAGNPLKGGGFAVLNGMAFDDQGRLESKLTANLIRWDTTTNKWGAWWYYIRETDSLGEKISSGRRIDTVLNVGPEDFTRSPEYVFTMTNGELLDYIDVLKSQGSDEIKLYLNEKNRRYASPFAFFILTLIGVSLSSRKIKGGIGMQIGIGLALTFSYILFMQFASQFSLKGDLNPALAMWIPNIIYTFIALGLYLYAPK